MYNRKQLFIGAENESVFFWGARQTGKSTLLKTLYPNALTFDLLLSGIYNDLATNRPHHYHKKMAIDNNQQPFILISEFIYSVFDFL